MRTLNDKYKNRPPTVEEIRKDIDRLHNSKKIGHHMIEKKYFNRVRKGYWWTYVPEYEGWNSYEEFIEYRRKVNEKK